MRKRRSSRGKKRLSDQLQGGEILVVISVTLVFFILFLFTLFYHNKNATNGYKLKTLREEREKILFEIEILDRQIADVSAINTKSKTDEENEDNIFSRPYKTKIIYLKKKFNINDQEVKTQKKQENKQETKTSELLKNEKTNNENNEGKNERRNEEEKNNNKNSPEISQNS